MQDKIGKVLEYDNYTGKIISSDDIYFFLDTDVIGEIKNGDLVKFRNENREDKRVFFVKKIETDI